MPPDDGPEVATGPITLSPWQPASLYNVGVIELKGVQCVAGGLSALQIEALNVPPGETAAVVGAVGSGREILLDLLLGRQRPQAGTVRVAGLDPTTDREALARAVGVMFADNRLYDRQSSLGNLQFFARLHGLSRDRVTDVLMLIGLADQSATRVDRLPPGLARRVAFGRALLHEPSLLILEDPFNQCDDATRLILARLIRQRRDDGGATLILTSDRAGLDDLCHTIYLLEDGRIAGVIRPSESAEALPFKIAVKMEGRVALVNPADILFAEAHDGRVLLHTTTEELEAPFTITELEQRLARRGFFRAHRSYLVNLQHVREIIPYTRSSFSLRLGDAGETKIPLSKEAAAELRDLLDY